MATVERTTWWHEAETGDRGKTTFAYSTAEPLAVTLDFGRRKDGEHIRWSIARDLLADGLTAPAGFGDVRCTTVGIHYVITLTSPEGHATLTFVAEQIRAFLIDTEELVPYGGEEDIVNAELDALLKDGAR